MQLSVILMLIGFSFLDNDLSNIHRVITGEVFIFYFERIWLIICI